MRSPAAALVGLLAALVALPACKRAEATRHTSMTSLLERVDAKLQAFGSSYRPLEGLPPAPPADDRTLSPYFHVPGSEKTDALPLKKTSATIRVAGVVAHVQVRQRFENTGGTPIEAVYVFPASTRAAVHAMRMKIGARTIEAKIDERAKARATYEAAKEAGKRTSLLEQQRPNVFTMNVANILPKDVIEVELDYSELLVPTAGIYELVYPAVVGPRYGGGADPKADRWIANPYLRAGSPVPYGFDVAVHLESPIAIADVASPSHKLDVKYTSQTSADIALADKGGGNRDLVLRYRLAGDQIQSGVLVTEQGDEKYFLAMVEPPARVRPAEIPPREYIFVVDVSGSMWGFPLEVAQRVAKSLLRTLRPSDFFNIVLFSGTSFTMSPESLPATTSNVARGVALVSQMEGGGGTELLAALRNTYAIPRPDVPAVSRTVVVITDGFVGVEATTFQFIRKRLGVANLFAFGIGSSVNRALIEGMARAGMGQSFVVLNQAEAAAKVDQFRTYVEAPVLTGIRVAYEGMQVMDVVPSSVPDLLAMRPLVLFGKFRANGPAQIRITGKTGKGDFQKTLVVDPASARPETRPARILWARRWVESLMDEYALLGGDKEIEQAVTGIGLRHHLLTAFTSFVAVDSAVAREGGALATVRQPLPLPQGVSELAVGAPAAAPAPHPIVIPAVPAPKPAPPPALAPAARPAEVHELLILDHSKSRSIARRPPSPAAVKVELERIDNVRPEAAAALRGAVASFEACLRGMGGSTVTLTLGVDGSVRVQGAAGHALSCVIEKALALTVARLDAEKPLRIVLRVR